MDNNNRRVVTDEELALQREYTRLAAEFLARRGRPATACVMTYGCQQNENDSEHLKGMLCEMGCELTEKPDAADILVINTCAVRENAEQKVFGVVGALKHAKAKRPDMVLAMCGCMAQQGHVAERIRASYPQVDLLFGTHALYRFPQLLYKALSRREHVFDTKDEDGRIAESLPVRRDSSYKAWLSVMSGCNNFCTYCVVPYVRGRERSRRFEDVLDEARSLVDKGYREITLLGQNVNSYGKDLGSERDFADLITAIGELPGDFLIRFTTSHPKDMSLKLIDAMAACPKAAKHLHLPFQSGSDEVLRRMNRGYTRDIYLERVAYAKRKIPGLALTSDVIVGFPGETESDFEDTLSLIRTVEFDNLFTFLYSKREGTPAARMNDPLPHADKLRRFNRLLEVQNAISLRKNEALVGKTLRVLCEGPSRTDKSVLTGHTEGNKVVNFTGKAVEGQFVRVRIDKAQTWTLTGTVVPD